MSNNESSTGEGYARDHHVENIFVSADKIQNHKQAPENVTSIIIVSYYVYRVFSRLLWKTGKLSLLDIMHWNELYFTGCSFASLPALIASTKWKASHWWLYDLPNKNSMETVF